jgi:hypothetical protein
LQGILNDSADEYDGHQRPTAKTRMEDEHRSSLNSCPACRRMGESERPLSLVLDVTDDGFAYMGDKLIERPVFFFARDEFAFQFGIVALVQLPQRRLAYFRDYHRFSLPSGGPSSLVTRFVVSLPHLVH